jgi:lipopolysaccharide export LptBFGC system permease protein LptF
MGIRQLQLVTPVSHQPPHTMNHFQTLSRAWLSELLLPVFVTWAGLVGVAIVGLVSQILVRLPVVPDLTAAAIITAGLLPEVGAMVLPIALFLGTVVVARRWRISGDLMALYATGGGPIRLLPVLLLSGGLGGLVVAGVSHSLAPAGRAAVRQAIADSGSTLQLQAGRPTWIGGVMVMAERSESGMLESVFVAQGDVVVTAPSALMSGAESVILHQGEARGIGARPWAMRFEELTVPLSLPPPRVHSTELAGTRLAGLIRRMEARGSSPHAERLVLLKRTTLGLGAPLLVLLALPLGCARRWTASGAVLSVLGLWGVQRLGDHLAAHWGALPSAVLPLAVLSAAVLLGWRCWGRP